MPNPSIQDLISTEFNSLQEIPEASSVQMINYSLGRGNGEIQQVANYVLFN
jgi:hypothetical protein